MLWVVKPISFLCYKKFLTLKYMDNCKTILELCCQGFYDELITKSMTIIQYPHYIY